jgi:hypothetical protein
MSGEDMNIFRVEMGSKQETNKVQMAKGAST